MALATTSIGGTGMGCYGHPGIEGREDIMVHWGDHEGVSRIAREIGRDKSTVSGEIARIALSHIAGSANRCLSQ